MKIAVHVDENIDEPEITIHCSQMTPDIENSNSSAMPIHNLPEIHFH